MCLVACNAILKSSPFESTPSQSAWHQHRLEREVPYNRPRPTSTTPNMPLLLLGMDLLPRTVAPTNAQKHTLLLDFLFQISRFITSIRILHLEF